MKFNQDRFIKHLKQLGLFLFALALILSGVYVIIWYNQIYYPGPITNFEDCIAAGYPILESYPAQCKTKTGEFFTQNIGNELIKIDKIQLTNPRPNALVTSPIIIRGQARGNWYFEASFPVKLLDAQGKILGVTHAQAQSDWMTSDFVPFVAELVFTKPETVRGTLILSKDNPSGLSEYDDQLNVPIKFSN